MLKYIFVLILSFSLSSVAFSADPFTVSGVPVDATGKTAIEAQTIAISNGQVEAAKIMIERLTLEGQRSQTNNLELSQEDAAKLIRALEIANEKRSGSRYLGDITVAFNPNAVQSYLRSRDLQMISTQSRPRLVIPILSGMPLWSENEWLMAWQGNKYANALTPIRAFSPNQGDDSLLSAAQARNTDINALRNIGQQFGVNQILIAETTYGVGNVSAVVTDVSLDSGQKRVLGQVNAPSYERLAKSVVTSLENDWKNASVSVSGEAISGAATVLYRSHREWQNLQEAINSSAQIQDARLDALSKDGALMTLTYGGDFNRLKTELSFKGVDIRQDPAYGLVLSASGRY